MAYAEAEPGKDHPLIGRYEGATMTGYHHADFDEVGLLQSAWPYVSYDKARRRGPEWLALEGKHTRLTYRIPEGRSSLEVLRNHQASLQDQGFETLFSCAAEDCIASGADYLQNLAALITNGTGVAYNDATQFRYLLARKSSSEGEFHVALMIGKSLFRAERLAWIEVVEAKPLETGRIKLPSAGDMAKAITADGRIALYGIHFDFDKADITPESEPQLQEIARLLAEQPGLALMIVGHTDNQGKAAYNLTLSQRRADAVVIALTTRHGIDADRLLAQGMGSAAPVASNDHEEGRARNRRVELVKQ